MTQRDSPGTDYLDLMRGLGHHFASVFVLCSLTIVPARATVHVFVRTKEGVWLGSDSLALHNDGKGHVTRTHTCKVVIQRRRLIFNAGAFKDVHELEQKEFDLPVGSIDDTAYKIGALLAVDHMEPPRGMFVPDQQLVTESTGIVQVGPDGTFDARIVDQTNSTETQVRDMKDFQIGIPHGMSEATMAATAEVSGDLNKAVQFSNYPKNSLLDLLHAEAQKRPQEVGPPFSILLLRKDGTVVDESDTQICHIPESAVRVADPHKPLSRKPSASEPSTARP